MKKVDMAEKRVKEGEEKGSVLNIKAILILLFLTLLLVVGVIAGVAGNEGVVSKDRKVMLEQCRSVSIDNIELVYPLTVDALKAAGFEVVDNEDTLGLIIDTEVFDTASTIKYNNKTCGRVVVNDNGEVEALKVALGHSWTVGELSIDMTIDDMINMYGEPDKAYSGAYSGYLYDLGDYRIYFNTNLKGGTPRLFDFVYISSKDRFLFMPAVIVGKNSIVLGEDIYSTIEELAEAGYSVEPVESEVFNKYDIKDKKGNRVGNLIYDGSITGTYTISFMGDDVGVGPIKKGMYQQDVEELMAKYAEPETLYDGSTLYSVGNVYSNRTLDVIVAYDENGVLNYIACNIVDIHNYGDFLPNDNDIEVSESDVNEHIIEGN